MTYTPTFQIVSKASSFPNSFNRTFAPKVLQVVHVTGNSDVAALPDGLTKGCSPYQDWQYAALNPASADGPSANNYVGRKGSTIQMWDPATHVAWSNGDVKSPNLALPGVKYLADLRAKGINANKGCYREIELSGYPGSYDPTDEQLEVAAYFAAIDSIATGLDIIRGETMLTHADINTIDRQNCAFRPAIREARMAQLVSRARAIRDAITEEPVDIDIKADPKLVDIPTGIEILNPDGSARLTSKADRTGVYSPGTSVSAGGTTLRLIVWTAADPNPDLLLAAYGNAVKNVRPVADCAAQVGIALDHVQAVADSLDVAINEARLR